MEDHRKPQEGARAPWGVNNMSLHFPNCSRSYDRTRQRVRFTGYDGMITVPFVVDNDALQLPAATTEDRALAAFDAARAAIYDVAKQAYKNSKLSTYVLSAADFR